MFLPKRIDRLLWNAKDGLDRRDESDAVITLVFFVVVLALIVVITIDNLLRTPPLQGRYRYYDPSVTPVGCQLIWRLREMNPFKE